MEGLYVVLIVAVFAILDANPWLIFVIIAGGIAFIVYGVKNSTGGTGGGGYSSTSASYSSGISESRDEDNSGSKQEGFLYRGTSARGSVLATYRNGQIFEGYNSGLNMSFIDATYERGRVYKGTGNTWLDTPLGRFENGYIYRGDSTWSSDIIGRYENGYIYKGNSTWYSDIIGTYTGDEEGGAAAAIVYLLK